MKRHQHPSPDSWPVILRRPTQSDADIEPVVRAILDDVAAEGDTAIRRYELRFGHLGDADMRVPDAEIRAAGDRLEPALREAIRIALGNITRFHEAQREEHSVVETMPGVRCWRRSIPIQRVGLYIPGGTAPLFSSLLMLGIPARIAGCPHVQLCTPAGPGGRVHPAILFCAQLLGITAVYRIGGAQAIAAMAFGTESVPRVDKILGPGNRYVDLAKRRVAQLGTAIDLLAGPSEVAVLADATCDPAFVAADLLSQAEHGADSQVMLVSTDAAFADAVEREVERQLRLLPRAEVARQAMGNSLSVVMPDAASALLLIDAYAPEHLILACEGARELAEQVVHAGSVFIGAYSCESAGDYASGSNHTLPTNGHARVSAGVSVDSFVRKTTFQELTREGLQALAPTIVTMAEAEGLRAHANAVRIRTGEPLPQPDRP